MTDLKERISAIYIENFNSNHLTVRRSHWNRRCICCGINTWIAKF